MGARKQRLTKIESSNILGAGAAGGGLGVVVAAFANNLPSTSPWKSALSVASPLIALGISGAWLFLKTAYIDPFVQSRKYRVAGKLMEKLQADARAMVERADRDPNASEEHKREVRKMVEDLDKLRMKKITERMEIVAQD